MSRLWVDFLSTEWLTKNLPAVDACGMTPKPASFREIIDLWQRRRQFAARLKQPPKRIYKMHDRNFIDLSHWDDVIAAVLEDHGIALTKDDLHAMAMATKQERGTLPPRAGEEAA